MSRPFLILPLLLLLACSGDDGEEEPTTVTTTGGPAPTTAVPPTSAVEASPTIVLTPVPPTTSPSATATASPGATGCGEAILGANDPARISLSELTGSLVFACEGQIWTAQSDGTGQMRLTQPEVIDWDGVRLYRVPEGNPPSRQERAELEEQMNSSPRWLADGRVVFASIRDTLRLSAAAPSNAPRPFVGATELYAINGDGTGEQRLTDYNLTPGSYMSPFSDFSPSECLFPDFCFAGLLTITPFSAANRELLVAVQIVEVRFSECCFLFGLLDISGAAANLTLDRFDDTPARDVVGWDWSADDRAALSTLRILDPANQYRTEFHLAPAGQSRSLPAYVNAGSLSPDATMVAYCSLENDGRGPWAVQVAPVSDEDSRVLFSTESNLATRSCQPRWSPDGSHLVLNDSEGQVIIINVETGDTTPVASGVTPDWGP